MEWSYTTILYPKSAAAIVSRRDLRPLVCSTWNCWPHRSRSDGLMLAVPKPLVAHAAQKCTQNQSRQWYPPVGCPTTRTGCALKELGDQRQTFRQAVSSLSCLTSGMFQDKVFLHDHDWSSVSCDCRPRSNVRSAWRGAPATADITHLHGSASWGKRTCKNDVNSFILDGFWTWDKVHIEYSSLHTW